jgi:hypothetical protein
MFGFERVGAVAFKALERALTLAAGRQRKDQVGPAAGASRTFGLAHKGNFMTLTYNCLSGTGLRDGL